MLSAVETFSRYFEGLLTGTERMAPVRLGTPRLSSRFSTCFFTASGLRFADTAPFPAKWTYRAIYRAGDSRVGQWSELGSRDIDGQTREGEQSG